MADRTRPWDDATVPSRPTIPHNPAYRPGVAHVGQPVERPAPVTDPTGNPITAPLSIPRQPLRYQMHQLKKGWEWSGIGGLFAFVCWGIWAISERGINLGVPLFTFVVVLLVAAGVFGLCRLLGRMVLERSMRRVRRGAWVSHAITGLFLAGVGIAYLQQTPWVADALTWVQTR